MDTTCPQSVGQGAPVWAGGEGQWWHVEPWSVQETGAQGEKGARQDEVRDLPTGPRTPRRARRCRHILEQQVRESVGRSQQTSLPAGPRLGSQEEPGAGREGGKATVWPVLSDPRINSSRLDAGRAVLRVPGSEGLGESGSWARRKPADGEVSPVPYSTGTGHRATFSSPRPSPPAWPTGHTPTSLRGPGGAPTTALLSPQRNWATGHYRLPPFTFKVLTFRFETVLGHQGCSNRTRQTGQFINNRRFLFAVRKPDVGVQGAGRVLVRTVPTAGNACPCALAQTADGAACSPGVPVPSRGSTLNILSPQRPCLHAPSTRTARGKHSAWNRNSFTGTEQLKRRCYCPQDTGRDPLRAPCSSLAGVCGRGHGSTPTIGRGPLPMVRMGLMGSRFRHLCDVSGLSH